MKNYTKSIAGVLVVLLVLPNIAFAAWWNPSSWSVWSYLFTRPQTTQLAATSTITTKATSSTETIVNTPKVNTPTIDNTAAIKAQAQLDEQAKIDAAVQAALAKQQAQQKAEQDAANLAAQNAANLAAQQAAQQQAAQNAANQAAAQAQNIKQAKLDAINLQIANLNAQYAKDSLAAKYSGETTSYGNAALDLVNSKYQAAYNALAAQYQQVLYGN